MPSYELKDFFVIIKKLKGQNSSYLTRRLALYNITYEQWNVLRAIKNVGTVNQKNLSLLTQKSSSTLTRLLDHLEKKNMIERLQNSNDRRSFSINITTFGMDIYQRASIIETDFHKKISSDISERDVRMVKQTINKVLNNIDDQILEEKNDNISWI